MVKKGEEKGIEKGIKKGREEGIEEGMEKGRRETIQNMLRKREYPLNCVNRIILLYY